MNYTHIELPNSGLDLEKIKNEMSLPEKHFMGGAITVNYPTLLKPGEDWVSVWLQKKGESQKGLNIETMGCTGYSTDNALGMIFKKQYGLDINISDRFVNKVSGTTKAGNSVDAPIDAIRKYGFLLESEYPWDRDTFTWDQYYSDISSDKMSLALTRLNDWDFTHEYVPANPDLMIKALQASPLVGGVYAWYKGDDGKYYDLGMQPNHLTDIVLGYKYGEYWICGDSYSDDYNGDETDPNKYLKKLDWNYKFQFIKRYQIIDKRDKKKINSIDMLDNFYYYWDGAHNFYYIGTPSGENAKYRQKITLDGVDTQTKFIYIALRKSMNQSSWAEVSKYPDIATINKKFA